MIIKNYVDESEKHWPIKITFSITFFDQKRPKLDQLVIIPYLFEKFFEFFDIYVVGQDIYVVGQDDQPND